MKKANVAVILKTELLEELKDFYLEKFSYPNFVEDLIMGKDIIVPKLNDYYSQESLVRWARPWCEVYLNDHPEVDVIMCQFQTGCLLELINKMPEEVHNLNKS